MRVVFTNAKSINIMMFSNESYQSICNGHQHLNRMTKTESVSTTWGYSLKPVLKAVQS